jgi:hypothetical protein
MLARLLRKKKYDILTKNITEYILGERGGGSESTHQEIQSETGPR